MPLTPFHTGPAILAGLILFAYFDLPALLLGSVIVDLEPLSVLLFSPGLALHGFFHSFFGASLLAVLAALLTCRFKSRIKFLTAPFKLAQDSSFPKVLVSSFFGVYSHVLLDSFLYADTRPFYPSGANPLLGLFSAGEVYLFCTLAFAAAIVFYLYVHFHK